MAVKVLLLGHVNPRDFVLVSSEIRVHISRDVAATTAADSLVRSLSDAYGIWVLGYCKFVLLRLHRGSLDSSINQLVGVRTVSSYMRVKV